ncbi:MAG: GIY-YIG nuclease family protein [Patescibacteria group bacterium]
MQSQALKNYKLPDKPGVYFFMGSKPRTKTSPPTPLHFKEMERGGMPKAGGVREEILYIGKATSLKDRVKSYFGKDLFNTRGPLIVDMVTKTTSLKWQETDSVLEALILEANLIKKHQPYYNTKEKDDKSFNYVCITRDKKIMFVRGKVLDIKKYNSVFGPFPSGSQLKDAMKIVRRIFPYIEERRGAKGKEEFYKQIKLFPLDSKENTNNIKNIKLFFEGKKQKVVKNLEKEMKMLAHEHEFEQANEIKKQLFALKHINDVALIKGDSFGGSTSKNFRIEAYDIAHMSGQNMVGVMTVLEDGEVNKNEYRKFKIKNYDSANDTGALLEVLERRFNHSEWQYPKLIVIDGGKAQLNVIKKFQARVGFAIPSVAVVKDERHKAKGILGDKETIKKFEKSILLANAEAHRFAIKYHIKTRKNSFLG